MFGEIFQIEKILGVCDRILYFLKINFFFLVSNLPVLLFFLFVGISQVRTYLPLFLICAVLAGPALSAVFFAMNRVLHKTDTTAWKDYKTGYLDSWGSKMGIAVIQLFLVWMFWTNVEFFFHGDPCSAPDHPVFSFVCRCDHHDPGSLPAGFTI